MKYFALACLGLGLMMSPLLRVGETAVPSNPKIGIVDMEAVLAQSAAGKRASEAFDKSRKAKQAVLDKQQAELRQADADLVKQKSVLKPEAFDGKRQELEKKFVDLQQSYGKLERELAQDRTKLIQDLLKQAEPKIATIARSEGASLIFDQAATVWIDPATNLTDKLIAEMK